MPNINLRAQGRDSTFTIHHTLLKKAVLQGKRLKGAKTFFGGVSCVFTLGEMNQISTKFVSKIDTADYNASIFGSNMAYIIL